MMYPSHSAKSIIITPLKPCFLCSDTIKQSCRVMLSHFIQMQEYRSRVAYCIPILANAAITYDVSVQQTPEMVDKGKPAGVLGAPRLCNPWKFL